MNNPLITTSINLLGHFVTDKVTKFSGTVTSISFDLYGCVQALVQPGVKSSTDEFPSSRWFDTNRLVVSVETRIMDPPAQFLAAQDDGQIFDKGPEDKPVK